MGYLKDSEIRGASAQGAMPAMPAMPGRVVACIKAVGGNAVLVAGMAVRPFRTAQKRSQVMQIAPRQELHCWMSSTIRDGSRFRPMSLLAHFSSGAARSLSHC
jgi:hypothetical protein